MNRRYLKRQVLPVLVVAASLLSCFQGAGTGMAQSLNQSSAQRSFVAWQSPAKLHRYIGSEKGSFRIGAGGIEFQAPNHSAERWVFQDIQTFRLSSHSLAIETYQNRKRHMPGMERYRFDLDVSVPSSIADELAREVQRPSQNAVPDRAMEGTDCVEISAHHRTLTGGTNGVLRFRDDGIDYVSSAATDSRRWRWADLQTLSDPDPYHLLVFGYRDTYAFDLKDTLPQSLFYRLVNALDAYNAESGQRPNVQSPNASEGRRCGAGDE